MEGMSVALLVASVLTAGAALQLPNYVKPCARSDPNFNECAIQHARETLASPALERGDRKYNLPALNPLLITQMKLSEGSGLTITITDAKLYGFLGAKVESLNFDFDKLHASGDFVLPVLQIIGNYQSEGRILLLPLNGKGDINITLVNAKMAIETDMTLETIGDSQHAVLKNTKATVTPSSVHIYLSNLFNGDKLLGKETNAFLNDNWKEVYAVMSSPITEAIVQAMETIMNRVSAVVPFEEAFPQTLP